MTQPLQNTPYVPPPSLYPVGVQLPFLKLGKSRFENGVDVTPSRLALATLTTGVPLPSLEAQRGLVLAGACPHAYDGVRVHEAGFHLYPEGVAAAGAVIGGGAALGAGVYGVIFTYEWEDAKGVLWRSAPSVPVSATLGAGDNSLSCTVPHLRLTDKQGDYTLSAERRGAVRIVGWRTVANGTTYYRDSGTASSEFENNPGAVADAIWISQTTNTLLVKNQILPTTGGGLENEAWPACTIVTMHQKRVFGVSQEETSFVWYTDEIDERFLAPATNEVYRIPVPSDGGSVVGLASAFGVLIIFCQRQIYYVQGDGPNRTGQQNGYSLPVSCSKTLGMMGGAHESIAVTADGVWFLSSTNGLRLLTGALQIAMEQDRFVGGDADGFFDVDYKDIRALSVPTRNQIRWYLSTSNIVVVWDYQRHQWSKFTTHTSTGGCVLARGTFFHSDGTNLYQSDTISGTSDAIVFSGSSTAGATSCVVETANIAVGGLQGFQRVYSMMLLMQSVGPTANLTIEVAYNYSDTFTETATVVLSGAANPQQVEHKLGKQQCEAVRFRLTWIAGDNPTPGGNTSELLRLTGMTLSVGLKGRGFPLPSANRA